MSHIWPLCRCMQSAGMKRRCLSRCAIEEFKRSSDSWRTHAQTAAAMRSEFAELLADEDAQPAQEGTTLQAASELPSTSKRNSTAETVSLGSAATLKPGSQVKKRKKKQRADMAEPPEAAAIAGGSAEQQKPRKRRHEELAAPSEDVLAQPDTKRSKEKLTHMLEGNGGAAPPEGMLNDPGEGQQKASRKRKGRLQMEKHANFTLQKSPKSALRVKGLKKKHKQVLAKAV